VANSLVKRIAMKDARDLVGNLAQTNHYLVHFSSLNRNLRNHLKSKFNLKNINGYISRKAGLLCSNASLPTSAFATAEVKDNFMGIPQEFAHTRLYTDLDFTFYVDSDYTNLNIFEGWMDYIASGSEYYDGTIELTDNYYRRMMYPDEYKVQTMNIIKFERDYTKRIEYQFINAFPKLVAAIPVSYGRSNILQVTVTFNYDRYIINPKGTYIAGKTDSSPGVYDKKSRPRLVRSNETLPSNTSIAPGGQPLGTPIPPAFFPPPPVNLPPIPTQQSGRSMSETTYGTPGQTVQTERGTIIFE
jgi:hypothetical protein